MNMLRWPKRLLKYTGIPLVIALAIYILLGAVAGWGFHNACAGIGLLVVAAAMLYLKQKEEAAERNVTQRIKAEYPTESQSQVLAVYEHLKIKDLEGLFLKILDDANGDLNKVKNLASIAENVEWKAFLENHW